MTITKTFENGTATFALEGWLDTAASPELGAEIDALTEASAIILDFANVEYMASAGLRQIIATHKKAVSLNAKFSVINVSPEVMDIFKMTKINEKLDIQAK